MKKTDVIVLLGLVLICSVPAVAVAALALFVRKAGEL